MTAFQNQQPEQRIKMDLLISIYFKFELEDWHISWCRYQIV